MSEHNRFYVVIQAGAADPVAHVFYDLVKADKAAQSLAVRNLGETFVVMEPKEAYRSSEPRAEKVFLMWRSEEMPEPPPAPAAAPDPDFAEVEI